MIFIAINVVLSCLRHPTQHKMPAPRIEILVRTTNVYLHDRATTKSDNVNIDDLFKYETLKPLRVAVSSSPYRFFFFFFLFLFVFRFGRSTVVMPAQIVARHTRSFNRRSSNSVLFINSVELAPRRR